MKLLTRLSCLLVIGGAFAYAQPQPFIGPHDLLRVTMGDDIGAGTVAYQVRDDGYIVVPLIGGIKAVGLTVSELELVILKKMNDVGLFVDPTVSVRLAQPSFVLAPHDVFVLTTNGASTALKYEVRPDGYVVVPLIGIIKAEGRTLDEMERVIADKLKAGQIVADPKVTLSVVQFNRANHR